MTLKNVPRLLWELTITVCLLFAVCWDVVRVASYLQSNDNNNLNEMQNETVLLNHSEIQHAVFMLLCSFIVKVTYTS